MIKVTAINGEGMWIDEKRVITIGPLMDRGVRQLNRAVLYFDSGLPPLPCKESVDYLALRVEGGLKYVGAEEDTDCSVDTDGRADGGPEARVVVEG